MGAVGPVIIKPGEKVPIRLLPPGGGASGGGYSPNIYVSIVSTLAPGETIPYRWGVFDKGGIWLEGEGKSKAEPAKLGTEKVQNITKPNAYRLDVENYDPTHTITVLMEWSRP